MLFPIIYIKQMPQKTAAYRKEKKSMEVTVSAKTVEEAVKLGAEKLGKTANEVTYEVVEEGKKGFLGMFSSETTVKVMAKDESVKADTTLSLDEETPAREISKTDADTVEEKVLDFLNNLIGDMGAMAVAKVYKIEENLSESGTIEKDIHICVEGKNLGMLIGRHGDVLDSLQYLCNIVVGRFPKNTDRKEYVRVILDIENYRAKRQDTLKSLARRVAGKVLESGRNYTLEPMSAYERRIIHSEVQTIDGVHTYSIGADSDRRVVVAYGNDDETEE